MKLSININYNSLEFTVEDIEQLKIFIHNQLKEKDLDNQTAFFFHKVIFRIVSIFYDVEAVERVVTIQQVTTTKQPIIHKPKLEIVR
jgi:hypothetical protein